MKRLTSLLFAALLIISATAGCGESAETPAQNAPAQTAETAAAETAEAPVTDVLENLPDGDYGGRKFNILLREGFEYEFVSEEENGDIINDAVYRRNRAVEEKFNIQFGTVSRYTVWGNEDKFNKELEKAVMSGSQDYDLVAGYAAMILGVIKPGLFINWYDIPNVDVSKPWWSPQIADSLTINGRLYAMTGDIALSLWKNMVCIYFNKKLAEDYDVGELYQPVYDGVWCFDRLQAAASKVSSDLDGDQKFTQADLYGYTSYHSTAIDSYMPAFNIQVLKRGEDGMLHFAINNEKTVGALEKLIGFFYGGSDYAVTSSKWDHEKIFKEDRSLFYAHDLRTASTLRDMETDYGMLPYPKYDEQQEKYYSTATDIFSLMLVPSTVIDPELVGLVSEALCSKSWEMVTPIYYDISLKDKYNRDAQSSDMLDLIRSSLIFDIGYLNSYALDSAGHLFMQLMHGENTDLASAYAKKEKSFQKRLEKMLEAYED